MAWSVPLYTKKKVDAAGDSLLDEIGNRSVETSKVTPGILEVINNWRAAHAWPLHVIRATLERRAKKISSGALIAQRIKRLTSIAAKLQNERHAHLKLSRIQDIGGCRAVMPTVEEAIELAALFGEEDKINSEFHRADNYIVTPKPDGYRSVHLIYKYKSDSPQYEPFNGQRIEIQIRSRLQHAWATAVETVTTFARLPIRGPWSNALKHLYSWQRFFMLMASCIAMREGQNLVAGLPTDKDSLVEDLRALADELHVEALLRGWTVAMRDLPTKKETDVSQFLIKLNPNDKSVHTKSFGKGEESKAFTEYFAGELIKTNLPGTQVVLVSVSSMEELRNAYPNYYADTKEFVDALRIAIE